MLPLIQIAATNSAKNVYFSLPVYRTACFGFCVYSKHNITSLRYNIIHGSYRPISYGRGCLRRLVNQLHHRPIRIFGWMDSYAVLTAALCFIPSLWSFHWSIIYTVVLEQQS